ncbi:MAG: tyrosine-type recombinase/integrase [Thermaerobacter sp.]|nr:tyrosine-type recombinase/integrase [Thermaerobacter sp.]
MNPAEAVTPGRSHPGNEELLQAYAEYVDRLPLTPVTRYQRHLGARHFLKRLHDLDWHDATVAAALHDVDKDASCFITYLLLFGHLRPGYPYLFSRKLATLVRESAHSPLAEDVAAVRAAAEQLGFRKRQIKAFLPMVVLRILVQTGKNLHALVRADLDEFRAAAEAWGTATRRTIYQWTVSLYAVETILYHMGIVEQPPKHPLSHDSTWADWLAAVPQQELRASMLRYVELMAAQRHRGTVHNYCISFVAFARYLADHAPEVQRISDLRRKEHIEPWLVWNASRTRMLSQGTRPISVEHRKKSVLYLKVFLDTITEWGWEESSGRPLLFNSDLPKLDQPLPRYIPRDQEVRLMAAIRELPDPFQRYPLEILRATGMRIGELVNLELDCLHEAPGQGTWLKVPLGKLQTERMVPVSDETVALFDAIIEHRGAIRPLPHPETGRPTEFLLVRRGHRVSPNVIREGLTRAVRAADLLDAQGKPLAITPHRLRHTFATTLINGGITVQALMRLLGHVSAEMSLRYGHLFDTTVRQQYEEALAQMKQRYAPAMMALPAAKAAQGVDEHWIEAPWFKTRLAHGYCQTDTTHSPCPQANVCERCPAFVPLPEAREAIQQQLNDVRLLVRDAQARSWPEEVNRHRDLAERLQHFLDETSEPELTPRKRSTRA